MENSFFSIILAFVEGFALIISPCILPILPLILSGSVSGGKAKPYGIVTGFVLTFTAVTLFSRLLVQWADIDPNLLRNISLLILLAIGIVLISSYLSDKLSLLTTKLFGWLKPKYGSHTGGYWNGVLFGGLLGIIWTPCAGPILAAVIVQSVVQKTNLQSILVTLFFAIGVAVPMLLIALLGRRVTKRFQNLGQYSTIIRRILGILIILGTIALYYEAWFLSLASKIKTPTFNSVSLGEIKPYPAPPFEGISAWINSPPLQLKDLKGQVVLIDFWTYSCINCIRTFPYLKDWYLKYHDQGFVIIGIHSPEFAFEQNVDNVVNAVKNYNLLYPVALDNQFVTWENYKNSYWPSHYLIDKNGNVVYQHFGEGNYEETENKIRGLLGLKPIQKYSKQQQDFLNQTPETYLGFTRAVNFANSETPKLKVAFNYTYPTSVPLNNWALQGSWIIAGDKIISAGKSAAIKIHFRAKNVYAVMGSQKPITVTLKLDGKAIDQGMGKDVINSKCIVQSNRLYELLNLGQNTEGVLELIINEPGLELYTFTFGS
jgi:cytochrome c biogenesis protein CcdA/glutathione peroxidase-family protein